MKIAVLGTGTVGQAIAARLAELGHAVTMGTRQVEATLARTGPDGMGNPSFAEWSAAHADVGVETYAVASAGAEAVVNATSGAGSLEALSTAGAENLAGKVVIDISNPLDFSQGFPPSLSVKDTDSLGEQIQRAFPDAKVVKTLNTMTAALMVHPAQLADGDHSVFVSGDDDDAKAIVTDLLHSMGHRDVIDLGDITTARGAEMWLPLWLRVMGALGTPIFNVKIVR